MARNEALSSTIVKMMITVLVRFVFHVWDVLTLPIAMLIYDPWNVCDMAKKKRATVIDTTDTTVTIAPLPMTSQVREEVLQSKSTVDTLTKLMEFSVAKYSSQPCLGTRPVLREEEQVQSNGKVFGKVIQGSYEWKSYLELKEEAEAVSRGLDEVGVEPGDKVVIFADTKAEWFITALGCFGNSVSVVTLYTNLGNDGLEHGINQSSVETVITSQSQLSTLARILPNTPNVKRIVFFEGGQAKIPFGSFNNLQLIPFSKLLQIGQKSQRPLHPPRPDDLAILMYTSGSTGIPKGALLTHAHLTATVLSSVVMCCNLMGEKRTPDEAYLAYLPLAHIFELTMEMAMMILGVKIGYSSPNTLTDSSTMIKKGDKGDASILKPTAMVAVPLILDRIYKSMQSKIKAKGPNFQHFFNLCYNYKLFWKNWGFDTPILNRLIFSKFRQALGGRIGVIVSGGAPLSPEVHEFLRTTLCTFLSQGYGLTETGGGNTLADRDDMTVGESGLPLPGVKVIIEDWKEGGYTIQDPEGPRGELHIGCPWTAKGYYQMEELTQASFYDAKGLRWFRTGDIGQLMPTGNIKIIDRKKDLVKLQMGEYVSLSKVETSLKVHPIVDNVCVYADPTKSSTIALVVPDDPKLHEAANEVFGSDSNKTREELCSNPMIIQHVYQSLMTQVKNLERFEIPKGLALIPDIWLPDTGLVTAALKLRRKTIQQHYRDVIEKLYESLEDNKMQSL